MCCNFTELSDEEFYEYLRWANTTLMKNYYDKQKVSTIAQIDHLYKEKDTTFRGFRHSHGKEGQIGAVDVKSKVIAIQGNKTMDGNAELVNWESSQSSDAERFSQSANYKNGNKNIKSFDIYLKKKKIRAAKKKAERAAKLVKGEAPNLRKNKLEKELLIS